MLQISLNNIPGNKLSVSHFFADIRFPDVSLVIPTKNEAKNLEILLPKLPSWIHEIIIVDGLSTDGTVETAKKLCPSAKIVLETRRGKGAALQAGFRSCTGEIIVSFDADCSAHFDELPLLITPLMQGYQLAKGSRYLQSGGSEDLTLVRRWGNWGLTKLVNLLYGARFTDLCYGFFALRRDSLEKFDLRGADGFEIETAIQVQALKTSSRIIEIPSVENPRVFGGSNLRTFRDGWRVLMTILRGLKNAARTQTNPIELTPETLQ